MIPGQARIHRSVGTMLFLLLTLVLATPASQAAVAEFGTGLYLLGYQSSLAACRPQEKPPATAALLVKFLTYVNKLTLTFKFNMLK